MSCVQERQAGTSECGRVLFGRFCEKKRVLQMSVVEVGCAGKSDGDMQAGCGAETDAKRDDGKRR